MNTPPCLAPWMSLILADMCYGPCCHYSFPAKREEIERAYADPAALAKLFNSQEILTLRKQFINNRLSYRCKACIKSGYNQEFKDILKKERPSTSLRNQVDRIRALVAAGEPGDGLLPVTIHLSQDAPCNLRCIFCEGAPPRPQDVDRTYGLFKCFFQTLEEIGWDHFHKVFIGGGEPFFNPGLLKFMREYDWSKTKGTCIATVSNATMLHKHFDLLRQIDTLYIRLSIDAMGEVYEGLRRGANWEKVYANLQEMSRIMREKSGWEVEIHAILMRSTLPYMTRLMAMAKALGFGFSVNSIRGNYIDENIFFFSDLLDGLEWETEMDAAIAFAREEKYKDAEKTFKHLRSVLSIVAKGEKAQVQSIACPTNRLRMYRAFFATFADKKFALWGTDHSLLDFLQQEEPLPGLTLVMDSSDRLNTYCGYPYRSIPGLEGDEEMLAATRDALDVVVVNTPTYKARQSIEKVRALFPGCDVLLRPFWDEKTQRNMEELADSGEPYVAFGAGGTAWVLLTSTVLRDSGLKAFSDNNQKLHGTELLGKPVVSPKDIPKYADRVVIFSEAYYDEIRSQLLELHGDSISIIPML